MRAAPGTPRRTCAKGSRSRCGPAAGGSCCSTACTAAGSCAPRPGGPPRPSRCGPRRPRSSGSRGLADWPAWVRFRDQPLRAARQALGPGRTRAAEDRGAAMSLAAAAEYALMLTAPGPPQPAAPGPGDAQFPGTGAGHPGRPGSYQRPDRRRAVHQRPHGRLAPGPDPGQDRLPPPRRPDPPGPDHGPGLARPASRPGTPGRRATRTAERLDLHPPADERNSPHDRA